MSIQPLIIIFYYTVVATCGASLAENCTYFESNGGEIGSQYIFVNDKNVTDKR